MSSAAVVIGSFRVKDELKHDCNGDTYFSAILYQEITTNVFTRENK